MVQLGNEHRGYPVEHVATFRLRLSPGFSADRRTLTDRPSLPHGSHNRDYPSPCQSSDRAAPGCTRASQARSRRFSHEEGIVDQVVMRKRCALRQSRGAAGELDIHGIVHLDRSRDTDPAACYRPACLCPGSGRTTGSHRAFPAIEITCRSSGKRATMQLAASVSRARGRVSRIIAMIVAGLEASGGDQRAASDGAQARAPARSGDRRD